MVLNKTIVETHNFLIYIELYHINDIYYELKYYYIHYHNHHKIPHEIYKLLFVIYSVLVQDIYLIYYV